MPSTSAEYPITKPGMEANSWRREKPLRTYGRQQPNATTEDTEPQVPFKKRKISHVRFAEDEEGSRQTERRPLENSRESKRQKQPLPTNTSTPATTEQKDTSVKKSSILSYFKPAAPATKDKLVDEEPKSQAEPTSPPSTGSRTKRRARLLRFKGTSNWSSDETTEKKDDALRSSNLTQRDNDTEDEEDMLSSTKPTSPSPRTGLRHASQSLHNANRSDTTTTHKTSGIDKKIPDKSLSSKAQPAKAPPTVQMTLNISSRAAFSECKVCDTVWNPQYPDDVRYHTKRHAAVLRGKKRKEASEL